MDAVAIYCCWSFQCGHTFMLIARNEQQIWPSKCVHIGRAALNVVRETTLPWWYLVATVHADFQKKQKATNIRIKVKLLTSLMKAIVITKAIESSQQSGGKPDNWHPPKFLTQVKLLVTITLRPTKIVQQVTIIFLTPKYQLVADLDWIMPLTSMALVVIIATRLCSFSFTQSNYIRQKIKRFSISRSETWVLQTLALLAFAVS